MLQTTAPEMLLVPFHMDSTHIQSKIDAWLSSPEPFAIQLVTGVAGSGKTRFITEMMETHKNEWVTGMLKDPFRPLKEIQKDLALFLQGTEPLLIGIDNAESLPTLLDILGTLRYYEDFTPSRKKVRVLLAARSMGDWWEYLPNHSPYRDVERALEACRPIRLPLPASTHIYTSAVHMFCGETVDLKTYQFEGYDTPLKMILAASSYEGSQHQTSNLLDALVKHEEQFWHHVLPTGFKRDKALRLLRQVTGVITLRGGLRTEEDYDALHERLKLDKVLSLGEVKGLFLRLYWPGSTKRWWLNPIQPQVGAEMLRRCLLEDMSLLEIALADNDADSLTNAFCVLEDIGQVSPELCVNALDTMLARDIEARVQPALRAAFRKKGKNIIVERLLIRLKKGVSIEILDQLQNFMSQQSFVYTDLESWVAFEQKKFSASIYHNQQAMILSKKSTRLSNLGKLEEALQASQESVEIYRGLAETNPDIFKPSLAWSLSNLGNRFYEMEKLEEALQATQEAVKYYRELIGKNPIFFNHLLENFHNLNNILCTMGRYEEAKALQQSVISRYPTIPY